MQRNISLLLFVLIMVLVAPPGVPAQEVGSISEVTGGVDVLQGGKLPAVPAQVGLKISSGDIVRTKAAGKVKIQFIDDSVLTIAPESRVAINEYVFNPEKNQREANIKIFHGLVHTLVNKIFKKETPDFTVETQTAVIGVRGTDYFTLVAPALSDIYNNSGSTEVRNIFAEIPGKVKLQGKEFTQVGKNLPPTLPMPLSQDDINWIKGQMVPKVAAKPSGGATGSGQAQLMSNVASSSATAQSTSSTASQTSGMIGQPNVIQNLQSVVFVPPQPAPPAPTPPVQILPTPFNIAISWAGGPGRVDLDLYLSGPTGTYYYGNPGSATSPVYYRYDSIVPNGGEVITVNQWTPGSTYTAYVQDRINQSDPKSTFLSSSSGVSMQFLKGGTVSVVPVSTGGSKAVVSGGTPLAPTISPPSGLPGNNWTAVTITPSTGTIKPVNTIGPYVPPSAAAATPTTPAAATPTPVPVATPTVAAAPSPAAK